MLKLIPLNKVIHIHFGEEVKIQIKEQGKYVFHQDKSIQKKDIFIKTKFLVNTLVIKVLIKYRKENFILLRTKLIIMFKKSKYLELCIFYKLEFVMILFFFIKSNDFSFFSDILHRKLLLILNYELLGLFMHT